MAWKRSTVRTRPGPPILQTAIYSVSVAGVGTGMARSGSSLQNSTGSPFNVMFFTTAARVREFRVMRHFFLVLLTIFPPAAADEARLALESKATADFERVQRALSPNLHDATICIQSQAALIPVTPPEGLSTLHYRKGYCTLAGAAVTGQASDY